MRPTKSQGDCSYCYHINENKVLSQIEEVLKKLTIPENVLLQLNEELKDSSNQEHRNQMQEIAKLKTQYTSVQTKIKTARAFLLDFTITKEEFDEIKADLEVQKANIEHKIQVLSRADSEFNKSLGTIFELLSKAYQLFKSSEIEEKRRIITIMFPNLLLDRETLVFTARKPFDLLQKKEGQPVWLPTIGKFRTKSQEIMETMGRVLPFEEEMLLAV